MICPVNVNCCFENFLYPLRNFIHISYRSKKRNRQNEKILIVSPTATVSKSARIGKNCSIGNFTKIGDKCIIGDNTVVGDRVIIEQNTRIGKNCIIQPGTVIGADGFAYERLEDTLELQRFPHIGGVIIGDNVEICSNCSIDIETSVALSVI